MTAFLQRPLTALPRQGEVASSDQPGSMPTSATSADQCFIPKPGKPPSHPTSLGPLGIICPDGKGVAGEIGVRLQSTLQQYHANLPQFAYIPGRGIQDAQLRVLAHIRRVQQLLQTHLRTKRARKFPGHINRPQLQSGFIFSLDLSQAFDKVKRQVILDALADAGAAQADIELVASLHRNSTYVVKYGSSRGSFRSTTGIKQGCKLAPSLFSLVTSFIFKKVGQDVSAEEVEGCLTGFADDLIVHKDIYCWRDLEIAHQLALSLLAHLEAAGFSVNPTKCCVMCRLKGRLEGGFLLRRQIISVY